MSMLNFNSTKFLLEGSLPLCVLSSRGKKEKEKEKEKEKKRKRKRKRNTKRKEKEKEKKTSINSLFIGF